MSLFIIELLIGIPVLLVAGFFLVRVISKGLDGVDFGGEGKNYDY